MSDLHTPAKKPAVRAWLRAADQYWAITADSLRQILDIAARATEQSWEAVATQLGKPLESTWTVELRNGVAIVPVMGPIFRHATLMTMFSGATSVQDLATDFQAAVENPAVKAILLNINSPGGEVDGINEMAGIIRASLEKKPVVAYVGGTAASGAYWLASQTREIVADSTALFGSIGVVATIRDRKGADEKAGITNYEIVSSQSPKKRVDPATDDGRTTVQAVIDDLAAEFIDSVAAGRKTTAAKVLADFGQGGVMAARKAIKAGMADRLGSFEALVAELAAGSNSAQAPVFSGGPAAKSLEVPMDNPNPPVAPAAAAPPPAPAVDPEKIAAEARTAAGTRIAAILNCDEAKGRENLAKTLALETETSPEAAKKILAAAPLAARGNPLAVAMAGLPNPAVGADAGTQAEEKTEIDAMLAFAPRKKGAA